MSRLEKQLIHNCRNGDQSSFKPLMNIYKNRLYSYLLRRTGSKTDAEDIMQEILIKVWRNIPNYKDENKFSSWLFSISYNTIIDAYRKKTTIIIDEYEDQGISENNPYEKIIAEETNEIICKAVLTLSENQKEVFLLRQHGELSFKEISDKLDQPLNTVLSHMRYAVKKIQKSLRQKNAI